MNSTEEDTFNKLRRPDFDNMRIIIASRIGFPHMNSDYASRRVKVLEEFGWDYKEYMELVVQKMIKGITDE